jgi:hypothetical protein
MSLSNLFYKDGYERTLDPLFQNGIQNEFDQSLLHPVPFHYQIILESVENVGLSSEDFFDLLQFKES